MFIDGLNHLEILTGYDIPLFGVARRKGGGRLPPFALYYEYYSPHSQAFDAVQELAYVSGI